MLGDAGSSTGGRATEGSAPSEPSEPEPEIEEITVDVVPITDVRELVPDGVWSPGLIRTWSSDISCEGCLQLMPREFEE